MLFNSTLYIFIYLPIVAVVYFQLNKYRLTTVGKVWLVLASLFFYGYWHIPFLFLIISSIIINYFVGKSLHSLKEESPNKLPFYRSRNKRILITGVLFNGSLLAYFKYSNFFLTNVNWILSTDFPSKELILPLGISFFTFQQIAYLVDCYTTDTKEYDFLSYCLFVTFFPQLIAGPIVHHKEMMPQFMKIKNKVVNWRNISLGMFVFFIGLFKKVVIADSFAGWANAGFDQNNALLFFDAWGVSLSYTFQLYYDFSGYSDMAIGAALIFNIKLPINFNSPYKSLNIQEFWHRWHMTLSQWLRDYLYIPLGGNRGLPICTYRNIFITFLLAGLWHGAAWTFVLWGALHGVALICHKLWKKTNIKMHSFFGWVLTFSFVNFSWVFFRAESFYDASRVLKGMFGLNGMIADKIDLFSLFDGHWSVLVYTNTFFVFLVILITFLMPSSVQQIGFCYEYKGRYLMTMRKRFAFTGGLIASFSLIVMLMSKGTEFLYFNF